MSTVWNTLSAGLHTIQEKLDHVLEGEQTDGDQVPLFVSLSLIEWLLVYLLTVRACD